jgi:two-component system KDP operon response regulator KdpE
VIDDDDAITASLAVVLRAKGFDVITAADGTTGFDLYRAHAPQIVISDIMMPGPLGIDTIGRIRRIDRDVLIIAMSGSIEERGVGLLDQACAAGADLALPKPFEMAELLDALGHFPHRPPPEKPSARQ